MLITIDIERKDVNNSAWILPIPGHPSDIGFDIESGVPTFFGEDIEGAYKDELEDYRREFIDWQLYSIFPGMRFLYFMNSATYTSDEMGGIANQGIEVHDSKTFMGINSELVTSTDPEALMEHLNSKGLPIQRGSLSSFDHYIQNNFSFIITWISANAITGIEPALYVQFHHNEIFYPMLLTGEYGDNKVPVKLLINDHVKFADGIELSKKADITYYVRGFLEESYYFDIDGLMADPDFVSYYFSMTEKERDDFYEYMSTSRFHENRSFYSGDYTLIEINTKASEFTQDLYFESTTPKAVKDHERLEEAKKGYHGRDLIRLIVFFIFTFISAIISSLVFFWKDKKKIPEACLLSMTNILAIWIYFLFTFLLFRKEFKKDEDIMRPILRMFGFNILHQVIFFTGAFLLIDPLFIFI
jgi:hypothetical protein